MLLEETDKLHKLPTHESNKHDRYTEQYEELDEERKKKDITIPVLLNITKEAINTLFLEQLDIIDHWLDAIRDTSEEHIRKVRKSEKKARSTSKRMRSDIKGLLYQMTDIDNKLKSVQKNN